MFSGFRELEFFRLFEPAQPGTAMVVEELASREEVLEVRISGMVGDSFTLRLDASTRGKDLLKMVRTQVSHKPGSRISLVNGANALSLTRSLKEHVSQDLGEEAVELAYVYTKINNIVEAWIYLNGEPVDNEEAADGITRVEGLENESLEQVILPSSLQTLTFGGHFDQSRAQVTLLSSLLSLRFGKGMHIFGTGFNQSLEQVTWPSSLQTLILGHEFNQSFEQPADTHIWLLP